MSRYDLMKFFQTFDSEADLGDFSPEELEAYLAAARGDEKPLTPEEWKARYFSYYDDVKDKSLKRQDW